MIRLGQKVRDVVSGFTGIVQCRTEWLNGCVRIAVQPPCGKDKSKPAAEHMVFDEEQLEVLTDKPIALPGAKSSAAQTGGGRNDALRRADPR